MEKSETFNIPDDIQAAMKVVRGDADKVSVNARNDEILAVTSDEAWLLEKDRRRAAEEAQWLKKFEVGDVMPDGWRYGGVSPSTGKAFFIAPHDSGIMLWKDIPEAIKKAEEEWGGNVRLPTKDELKTIFNKRAQLDSESFSQMGAEGWYYSLSPNGIKKVSGRQHFKSGECDVVYKHYIGSLRLVRDHVKRK